MLEEKLTRAWSNIAWITCLQGLPNLEVLHLNSPLLLAPDNPVVLENTIDKWGKSLPDLRRIYLQDAYDDHEEHEDLEGMGSHYFLGRVMSFGLDENTNSWKDTSHSVLGFPGSYTTRPYYKKTREEDRDILDTDDSDLE